MTRAPVAPSGWPSEMPPPFGLMSSKRSSSPASCANWSTTEANASLTSITEMSSQPSPALASAFRHASGLPWSIRYGSTPDEPERDEPGARLEPEPTGGRFAHDEHRRGAVDDLARVAGGDDTVGQEGGLERGELLGRRVAARRLVDCEEHGGAGRPDLDRNDLVLEAAVVDRRRSPAGATRARTRRVPRATGSTRRRAPRQRFPAGRSASVRAACPRDRRRSSPSGRATSSRPRPRRRRRAARPRPRPPR